MDNQQGEYDYLIGTEVGVRSSSGEEIDRKVIINSYKCVGDDTVFLCSDGKMYEEDELDLIWKVGPSGIMMIWFSENWTAFDAILKNIVKPVGVCMSFIKVLIDYGYVKVDSDKSLPEDKIDKINTIGDSLITDWLNENRTVIENIIIELRSIDDMHDYWCDEYNELFDKFMKKLEDNNILRFKKADDEPV